jgi:hypothetical protein
VWRSKPHTNFGSALLSHWAGKLFKVLSIEMDLPQKLPIYRSFFKDWGENVVSYNSAGHPMCESPAKISHCITWSKNIWEVEWGGETQNQLLCIAPSIEYYVLQCLALSSYILNSCIFLLSYEQPCIVLLSYELSCIVLQSYELSCIVLLSSLLPSIVLLSS